MRILVFSERLRHPLDEGFKNTAIHLIRTLRRTYTVLALTTFGEDIPEEDIRNVVANRLLLGGALRRAIQDFQPDVGLYIPTASATPAAMLRTRVLASYAPYAKLAMVALQPRAYDPATRLLIRLIKPRLILAQSSAMVMSLRSLGCRVATMHGAVDTKLFSPVCPERRSRIRERLRLPQDAYICLHVGHINNNRNVHIMARLQEAGCQAVLVGSTSTSQDEQLAHSLQTAGVMVVRHYVKAIEQYYQAADCYVFPVFSSTGAIAVPLSILEAMACNVPVVTTAYGDLPILFRETHGLSFVHSDAEFVAKTLAMRQIGPVQVRSLVTPFTWQSVADDILRIVTAQA